MVDDPYGSGAGAPLTGQLAYLDLKGDGTLDPGDPTAVTDANGIYTFAGLTPGAYTVRIAPFAGESVTYPAGAAQAVTTTGGQSVMAGTFGVSPGSSVLPLVLSLVPFGTNNPDLQTAEVTGLYQTILGRAPDPTGLAAGVAYLKGGGSVQVLATAFLNSPEYDTRLVASYYTGFLGRPGSVGEINSWVSAMQMGLTVEQFAADFLTAATVNTGAPTFIQTLYQDLIGRQGTAPDVAAWEAALAAGLTRSQAIDDFLAASDPRTVTNMYQALLIRPPDADGLSFYLQSLQAGATLTQVAASIAGSPEYAERANATVKTLA